MIYLDNAATAYPKAPGVARSMYDYVEKVGATINRSSYASAQKAGLVTLTLRERLCRLFGHPDPTRAVITPGATAGLNMVIKGPAEARRPLHSVLNGAQRRHAPADAA